MSIKTKKHKQEFRPVPDNTIQVEIMDMLVRKLPTNIVKGFDEQAKACGLTRKEYFIEVYDRIYPVFLKVKYASDLRMRKEAEKIGKRIRKRDA